jgi:hypothetical protein
MSSNLNFDFWNEYLGRLKSTFSVVLLLSYSAWLLSPEKWPFAETKEKEPFSEVGVNFRTSLCNCFTVPKCTNHVVKEGKKHYIFQV